MNYEFPKIETLEDVLPAIVGRDEFIIANRGDYQIVNYMVAMTDTFPPVFTAGGSVKMREEQTRYKAIRRECRGMLFDAKGNILSRRFHKFFNVNERDETLVSKIDFSNPHIILEKLDGSMVTPFQVRDHIRWGTKMGITDTSMNAEEFVARNSNYHEFADLHLDRNQTPIFEWCSRKNRIVIDYPIDRLVLTAIRDNITGEYKSYDQMKTYAEAYGIDIVKSFSGTAESMQHLIDSTREMENVEGWVVRFDTGHMLKVKGEWYVRIHKTKDNLNFEKNIIDLIINEKIDDAKSFMLDADRIRVEEFEKKFWSGHHEFVIETSNILNSALAECKGDKKTFAMSDKYKFHPLVKSMMFTCWDGTKSIEEACIETIRKNVGTQKKVDLIRFLWGNAKWQNESVE